MGRASSSSRDIQWFVLNHGWRAKATDLAHILGVSTQDVLQVRKTGACKRLPKARSFTELFAAWHGCPPAEQDWPPPASGGAGSYEWQASELALLASLVGRLGVPALSRMFTKRLRLKTGDKKAARTRTAIQVAINRIGLQASDLVGGITTAAAGREIGSLAIINQSIRKKQLPAVRVGRLWMIPHEAWTQWKSKRVFPPKGFIPLRDLRGPLSVKSDKLSEYARAGHVPTAVRCNPYGTKGKSTQFGTWWLHPKTARKLIADRRAGRPMPWHGKPYEGNLKVTYALWTKRRHPATCETCRELWGKAGAPGSYEDYLERYPPLAHGAKRHLTMPWRPGITMTALATETGRNCRQVKQAIDNGLLAATRQGRALYITRTDATRWKARKCPTGQAEASWISLASAKKQHGFGIGQLRQFVEDGSLVAKPNQSSTQEIMVSRHQCAMLREKLGFSEKEAAKRAGVTIPRLRVLLRGVDWRGKEGIPLATVQAVIKRLESREGYTVEEAAVALKVSELWVKERINDGTVKVVRAKWDRRRQYLTQPMFQRLKKAKRKPVRIKRFGPGWILLSEAANEAGVSATTIINWASKDSVVRERSPVGWRYRRASVRIQARQYWKSVRNHRAVPPAWLSESNTSKSRR